MHVAHKIIKLNIVVYGLGYVHTTHLTVSFSLTKKTSLISHSFKSSTMLLKANTLVYVPRRFVQALFVSHRNAKENLRALWPIFDYKSRLGNRKELEENVKRRQLSDKINVADLCDKWELYKSSESRKEAIEKRRAQLSKLIIKLKSAKSLSEQDQNSCEAYIQEARTLRKDYDGVCDSFYDIQERFNIDYLALPNQLLPNTPDEEQIVYEFGSKLAGDQSHHHLNYHHLINFFNETCYFLQNEAATFDLNFPLTCVDYFRQHDFAQFSNADFTKTIVVEGGGVPLESLYEIMHDFHENYSNLVHLVGSGSWLSFLGYIAKTKVDKTLLPLQFVSTGRIYHRTVAKDLGLLDAVQSTAIQIFVAGTEQQANERFQVTLGLITKIYKALNLHFRVVQVPASQLETAECSAVRIEMFSRSLNKYIAVGNLSMYSNYISYRLRFQCEKDETNSQYKPHIFGGTVCNVTKLLAIILETYDGTIPRTLLNHKLVK